MEFVVNDNHKKMIINREVKPIKVNCHIDDKLLRINLYSGCILLNSIDGFSLASKDLYDIYYDKSSDLFVIDDIETNNISCAFSTIYKASLNEVKHR